MYVDVPSRKSVVAMINFLENTIPSLKTEKKAPISNLIRGFTSKARVYRRFNKIEILSLFFIKF